MRKITEPGLILDLDPTEYFSDPCPAPSLSSSIAKLLIDRSPAHAYACHPRLGGAGDEGARKLDFGAAAHALLLKRGRGLSIIAAEDYRTKDAKAARDQARAQGCIPILEADYERARDMVKAAREQLATIEDLEGVFEDGEAEAVIAWREGEIWCRAMIDWLSRFGHGGVAVDYKTVSESAHPAAVARRLLTTGADIQDAFYRRGIAAEAPTYAPARFVFVCQEIEPPYLLSAVELDHRAQMLGEEKVQAAIEIWRGCMRSGQWPGYEPRIATVECPPWHARAWHDRVLARAAVAQIEGPELVEPC